MLTELLPKRSRQRSPRGEIGSRSTTRWRPRLWHPALPPGIGARGFLCNLKTKGLYGLRGAIVSVEATRAGVRIDETGKLVSILRANLVFDADYPECLQKSDASGPTGLPGFLHELIFFASHPGGSLVAAARGSAEPPHYLRIDVTNPDCSLTHAESGSAELPNYHNALTSCSPDTGSLELPHASLAPSETRGPPRPPHLPIC